MTLSLDTKRDIRFNCTFMELKLRGCGVVVWQQSGFNCTFMELKLRRHDDAVLRGAVF